MPWQQLPAALPTPQSACGPPPLWLPTGLGQDPLPPPPQTMPKRRPEIPRGPALGGAGGSGENARTSEGGCTEVKSDPKPTPPVCGVKAADTTVTPPVRT